MNTRNKFSSETRSSIKGYQQEQILSNSLHIIKAFHRLNELVTDVEEKIHLERIFCDATLENGDKNIRVNSVALGAIDTPMLRGALEQFHLTEKNYSPQLSLLNRFGKPKEVAQASLWLASDLSSYVTGTTIHVDAGYTSR